MAEKKTTKRSGIEKKNIFTIYLMISDVLCISFSYFFSLWIRFDAHFKDIPAIYLDAYAKFAPLYAVFCLIFFFTMKMYQSVWRYAGISEFYRSTIGSIVASTVHFIAITLLFCRMPLSYYFLGMCFQLIGVVCSRFAYRIIIAQKTTAKRRSQRKALNRVMLIGAGEAGTMILKDVNKNKDSKDKILCIIDDNSNKWNRYIDGVPIVGGRSEILKYVEKYRIDKIFVAMPSAPKAAIRDILNICNETGCELMNLPGLFQFVEGKISVSSMKEVSVEDLLGREPIRADLKEISDFVSGKVVLVTGGGGSIGSELCRQIASYSPEKLIIFDVYENNAYDIQLELREKYPDLDLHVLIGSVRDSRRLDQLFKTYHPQIVYHAAAHKHVPLMEDSPCESIKNNVVGTYKTAYAAMMNGCKRFVLISTDKAVNPTNIMGASKRLCEMVIQSFDMKIKEGRPEDIPKLFTHAEELYDVVSSNDEIPETIDTEFVAVRFGNVLGSNGSVVPVFKRQIAAGGPVKVTHPDIIRYFMTIPEAVSLVLLAGADAKGGEIFVLDMGSPVKIDDLARNLIKLSGLKPDIDIKIEYTGLRPGEKLYEEKLLAEEGLKKTKNNLIHIGCPIPFDVDEFHNGLEGLMQTAYRNDDSIKEAVMKLVSTYHPS